MCMPSLLRGIRVGSAAKLCTRAASIPLNVVLFIQWWVLSAHIMIPPKYYILLFLLMIPLQNYTPHSLLVIPLQKYTLFTDDSVDGKLCVH